MVRRGLASTRCLYFPSRLPLGSLLPTRSRTMEAVLQHITAPQMLPIAFGFISCLVSGTLALGEGIIFMLLYEVSRSYGLFGVNTSRFEGILFSLLISTFSQLPIVFAGRHEMSIVLGYGVCMGVVSLVFITLGVVTPFSF